MEEEAAGEVLDLDVDGISPMAEEEVAVVGVEGEEGTEGIIIPIPLPGNQKITIIPTTNGMH